MIIQTAQNNLSNTYLKEVFTTDHKKHINPEAVQLIYNTPIEMPMFYYVDIWSAVMATSVHALNIKEKALKQIVKNDTSVFFILNNAFNNILSAISESTKSILDETDNISSHVVGTL